jgi:hypothetical protein
MVKGRRGGENFLSLNTNHVIYSLFICPFNHNSFHPLMLLSAAAAAAAFNPRVNNFRKMQFRFNDFLLI